MLRAPRSRRRRRGRVRASYAFDLLNGTGSSPGWAARLRCLQTEIKRICCLDSVRRSRESWAKVESLPQPRIADVAALAGVGEATVSRVLNGRTNVRPA